MIYDNSTGDTFTQFYTDDPLGFLNKRNIDTKEAMDRMASLVATEQLASEAEKQSIAEEDEKINSMKEYKDSRTIDRFKME